MENLINSMIDRKAAEYQSEREREAEEKRAKAEKLVSAMKERLGEFWTIIEEQAQKTGRPHYAVVWDGSGPEIRIDLPALDEYRLAPIFIKWNDYSDNSRYSHYRAFHVGGYSFSDIGEALLYARNNYPEYKKKDREEKIEKFNSKLLHYGWNTATESEEEALSILEAHLAEFPDREEDARDTFEEWKKKRANYLALKDKERRDREEEQAKRALFQSIKLAYIQDLAQWLRQRDEIDEENKKLAQRIQDISDSHTYTVYELTYALIASYEEDGEQYRDLETRSVYTLYALPDSFGFWDIDGKKVKIFHPVSIERMEVKASSGILAKTVSKSGIDFYFDPEIIEEKIPEILADIQDLPETPREPEELKISYYGNMRDYIRQARALLSGEELDRDEIPF